MALRTEDTFFLVMQEDGAIQKERYDTHNKALTQAKSLTANSGTLHYVLASISVVTRQKPTVEVIETLSKLARPN